MIDIIIPAYNCSKTLPKLLASIGAQTQPNKCIVTIVDDCSTEDLKPIIKDFKKYFNIKLQYIRLEENLKWPGLVRQVGLEKTNAPYVMFLDSDDFLSPRAVELANREMRCTDADVIIGHFYGQKSNKQWCLLDEDQTTWLHGNIYKRKFLLENNIYFESLYNEDGAFNTECFILAKTISYLPEPLYFWSYNSSSITKSEYFAINNLQFFVKSLQRAYEKIFSKPHSGLAYSHLGQHIWGFYTKFDGELRKMSLEKNDNAEQSNLLFSLALKDFSDFLKNHYFTNNQKKKIKEGFLKGYLRLEVEGDYISIEDFINKFNFKELIGDWNINESSNN